MGDLSYLASAEVHVLNVTELGESGLQSSLVYLAVDVLDVGALLVGVDWLGLVLDAGLLLLVASHTLPSRLTLAVGGRLVASWGRRLGRRGSGGGRLCRRGGLGLSGHLLRGGCCDDGSGDLVGRRSEASPCSRGGGLGGTGRHGDRGGLGGRWSGRRSRFLWLLGLSDRLLSSSFRLLGSLFDGSRRGLLLLRCLNLLWYLFNGGSRSDLLSGSLLQLLVDLVQIFLAGSNLVALVEGRVLGEGRSL